MSALNGWVLKYPGEQRGVVEREEFTDRAALDDRVAALVQQGRCCVVVPKLDERAIGLVARDGGLLLGPSREARFVSILPRTSNKGERHD